MLYPVYCFDENGRKVEVFHGLTADAAFDFATTEKWDSQPNGFYLGVSRECN
jgi:hypothetical protein